MKKLIVFIMMCALTISLCACGVKTIAYSENQEKFLNNEFTIIKEVTSFERKCRYIYDNNTKIIYLHTTYGHGATMCPYYTIVDGKPELAIYGVNWTE